MADDAKIVPHASQVIKSEEREIRVIRILVARRDKFFYRNTRISCDCERTFVKLLYKKTLTLPRHLHCQGDSR